MITDTGIPTREFCDASAVQSEYAANYVLTPRGGTLALCQHHTDTNAQALVNLGATIVPIPNIYADAAEQNVTEPESEFSRMAKGRDGNG
jgi:hypothetical protein